MKKTSNTVQAFLESRYYIVFCAVVAYICWRRISPGVSVALFIFLIGLTVLAAKNLNSILPVLFFFPFSFSNDAPDVLPIQFVCGIFSLVCFVHFMLRSKTRLFSLDKQNSGLLMIAGAFFISAIANNRLNTDSVLFVSILVVAFLVLSGLRSYHKNNNDTIIFCFVMLAVLICVQMITSIVDAGGPDAYFANKGTIYLGWGVSNTMAMIMLFCPPFLFYLIQKSKLAPLYYVLAFVMGFFLFLTFSRGCILIAGIAYPFLIVYSFIKTKNKKLNLISLGVSVVALLIVCLIFKNQLLDLKQHFSALGLDDNGRLPLFEEAFDIYKNHLMFGEGITFKERFAFFAHNSFLYVMAASGTVGLMAFTVHIVQKYYNSLFLRKTLYLYPFIAILLPSLYGLMDRTYFTTIYLVPLICIMCLNNPPTDKTINSTSILK